MLRPGVRIGYLHFGSSCVVERVVRIAVGPTLRLAFPETSFAVCPAAEWPGRVMSSKTRVKATADCQPKIAACRAFRGTKHKPGGGGAIGAAGGASGHAKKAAVEKKIGFITLERRAG